MKLLQNFRESFNVFMDNLDTTSSFLLGAIASLIFVCFGVLSIYIIL